MQEETSTTEFEETLVGLGFKDHEAKIYLACLGLGSTTVGKIAQNAGVQRTFAYDILNSLAERGLVSVIEKQKKLNYSAISLDQFRKIQENKFKRFEQILPELKALEKTVGDRPKISFYEGKDGLLAAQYDTLNMPVGSEILAYAAAEGLYYDEPGFAKEYIRQRVKKKIKVRAITPDSAKLQPYISQNEAELRNSRIVPAEMFPSTNEIDIYGNKVAILSYSGELLAVIIESESIAKTQRVIFELAWLGAGVAGKNKE